MCCWFFLFIYVCARLVCTCIHVCVQLHFTGRCWTCLPYSLEMGSLLEPGVEHFAGGHGGQQTPPAFQGRSQMCVEKQPSFFCEGYVSELRTSSLHSKHTFPGDHLPRPHWLLKNRQNQTKNRLMSQRSRTPCVSVTACGYQPSEVIHFRSCKIHMKTPLPIYPALLPRLAVSNFSSKHYLVNTLGHNFTRV